jgi:hypothetical protein
VDLHHYSFSHAPQKLTCTFGCGPGIRTLLYTVISRALTPDRSSAISQESNLSHQIALVAPAQQTHSPALVSFVCRREATPRVNFSVASCQLLPSEYAGRATLHYRPFGSAGLEPTLPGRWPINIIGLILLLKLTHESTTIGARNWFAASVFGLGVRPHSLVNITDALLELSSHETWCRQKESNPLVLSTKQVPHHLGVDGKSGQPSGTPTH